MEARETDGGQINRKARETDGVQRNRWRPEKKTEARETDEDQRNRLSLNFKETVGTARYQT